MRLVIAAVVAALVVPATAEAQAPTGLWSLSSDGHPRVGNGLPVSVDALRYCLSGGGCTEIDDICAPVRAGRGRGRDVLRGRCLRRDPAQRGVDRSRRRDARAHHARHARARRDAHPGRRRNGPAAGATTSAGSRCYVCRTEGGDDCVFSTGAVRAEHNGRYAFAVDSRAANNDHVGPPPPDGAAATLPSRTATVVGLRARRPDRHDRRGRAADPGAQGARRRSPGTTPTTPKAKKPKVTLRKRALRSGKRLTVGSITCATRCRVRLSVGDGRRTVQRTLSVSGTTQLTIVNGSKLRKKVRLRVVVTVDGKRLKTGRVRELAGFGPDRRRRTSPSALPTSA